MRGNFLRSRSNDYSKTIYNARVLLDRCVTFINCKNSRMCRTSGHSSYQRAVRFGHRKVHYLIYQTMKTSGCLMFFLFGPMEGLCHEMMLLRQQNWNKVWRYCQHIGGKLYHIYEYSVGLLFLDGSTVR